MACNISTICNRQEIANTSLFSSETENETSIQTWVINDTIVRLVMVDNKIIYKKINKLTGEERPFQLFEGNQEKLQKILNYVKTECEPVINSQGGIDIAVPVHCWLDSKERYITLLETTNSHVCQVCDVASRSLFQYFLPQDEKYPLTERRALYEKMNLNQVLEQLTKSSEFDSSVVIDTNHCALTLFSAGEKSHGHAVIAIEGFETGFPYLWYAHLRGPEGAIGRADVVLDKNVRYKVTSDTKTWLRSKEKVQNLINRTQWEREQQLKGIPWVFFNIAGADSTLVSAIKIKEFKNIRELISFMEHETPKREPTDFLRLLVDVEDHGYFRHKKGSNYIGHSKSMFIEFNVPEYEYMTSKEIFNVSLFVKPDNCMTWARRMLTIAGVFLTDNNIIYTMPTEYTEKKKGKECFRLHHIIENPLRPCGLCYFDIDYTDEIQKQVGPHSWKLTEESFEFLESWREEKAKFVLDCQSNFLLGTKFIITVEANGKNLKIDLSKRFNKYYSTKKQVITNIEWLENLPQQNAIAFEELKQELKGCCIV